MGDIPDEFPRKREWPDDAERVCTGSNICYSTSKYGPTTMAVHETPVEVKKLMDTFDQNAMLEFHHHADITVLVYVRNEEIISIDARWEKPQQPESPETL